MPRYGGSVPCINPLMLAVAKVLKARGLRQDGKVERAGKGWLHAKVVDIKTGDGRGERWLKREPPGGWAVVKEAP